MASGVTTFHLIVCGSLFALALGAQQAASLRPGEAVEDRLPREGEARYRLVFSASGTAVVEVSGAPADCRLQVGSQGFQESDSAPAGWTDGQPGGAVRHVFRVQAGRPGTVWVKLRERASGLSVGDWSGVACSPNGPYYTLPGSGAPGAAPSSVEGRPVHPPITFRLLAQMEGTPAAAQPSPPGVARPGSFRDERLRFAIEYPAGEWTASGLQKGTLTLTGRAGASAAGAVITVTVVPKADVPNSSDFLIALRMHERLTEMGAVLTSLGGATLDGRPAVHAGHIYDDRTAQGKLAPFDHLLFVANHGANYYLLAFVAPHEVFVRQTPSFKRIFNSWRFLP